MSFYLPALTFFDKDGNLDVATNDVYAQHLSTFPFGVLLFGTTGEGPLLAPDEKLTLVGLYDRAGVSSICTVLHPRHDDDVIDSAAALGTLMHSPWPNTDIAEFVSFHRRSSGRWAIYSHPKYSRLPFTPDLARHLVAENALPWGAKVSKVDNATLCDLRSSLPGRFELWHGSDRDIAGSLKSGANVVVSQTLAAGAPDVNLQPSQAVIDKARPDGPGKLADLKRRAVDVIHSGTATTRRK